MNQLYGSGFPAKPLVQERAGGWCLSHLVSPASPAGRDSLCHLNLWGAAAGTKEASLARASSRGDIPNAVVI